MPPSRTDYKEAMRGIARKGVVAGKIIALTRWERVPSEIVAAKKVLRQVARVGLDAQDVLDQMEENDE